MIRTASNVVTFHDELDVLGGRVEHHATVGASTCFASEQVTPHVNNVVQHRSTWNEPLTGTVIVTP